MWSWLCFPKLNCTVLDKMLHIKFEFLHTYQMPFSWPWLCVWSSSGCIFFISRFEILISSACVVFSRGGAEETAGRDQCGLSEAGAGERAKQEDRLGAEDEWGAQDQVRKRESYPWNGRQEMRAKWARMGSNSEGTTGNGDTALCNISAEFIIGQVWWCLCVCVFVIPSATKGSWYK